MIEHIQLGFGLNIDQAQVCLEALFGLDSFKRQQNNANHLESRSVSDTCETVGPVQAVIILHVNRTLLNDVLTWLSQRYPAPMLLWLEAPYFEPQPY